MKINQTNIINILQIKNKNYHYYNNDTLSIEIFNFALFKISYTLKFIFICVNWLLFIVIFVLNLKFDVKWII